MEKKMENHQSDANEILFDDETYSIDNFVILFTKDKDLKRIYVTDQNQTWGLFWNENHPMFMLLKNVVELNDEQTTLAVVRMLRNMQVVTQIVEPNVVSFMHRGIEMVIERMIDILEKKESDEDKKDGDTYLDMSDIVEKTTDEYVKEEVKLENMVKDEEEKESTTQSI